MATDQPKKLQKYRFVVAVTFETEAENAYEGLRRASGLHSAKLPDGKHEHNGGTVKVMHNGLITYDQIYDDEVVELREENERLKEKLKTRGVSSVQLVVDDVEVPDSVVAEVEALLKKKQS